MGLSRRTFTKEFKLAAVRRLESVSMAEVSRALEVSPNVLHRRVREFRQALGNAFPGQGQRRWSEGRREFLEKVYNQQRLHSALGYVPPAEFEVQPAVPNMEAASRQHVA